MAEPAALLPGTLDLLILKAVSLGQQHGYGVLLRIEQISAGALRIQQGALYPALYRLEHRGLIESEWGVSENNRRAKYYRLTARGRRWLGEETASWNRLVVAIALALRATPQEIWPMHDLFSRARSLWRFLRRRSKRSWTRSFGCISSCGRRT